jgi:hypothetical protein
MQAIFEKKAKLVGSKDQGVLWLLNIHDDWIHDQYGESYIYYGTVYSSHKPFHPLSTSVTGYFQDEDSKKWIKLKDGMAFFNPNNIHHAWKNSIEEMIRVTFKTGIYRYYKCKNISRS